MEFLFNLSYHPIHARTRKDIYVYSGSMSKVGRKRKKEEVKVSQVEAFTVAGPQKSADLRR